MPSLQKTLTLIFCLWTTLVHAEAIEALDSFEHLLSGQGVEAAEAGARKILESTPQNVAALEVLAMTALLRGREREALHWSLDLLELDPSATRGEALLRDLLRYSDYTGCYGRIEAVLDRLVGSPALSPGARRVLARWRLFFARHHGDPAHVARAESEAGLLADWLIVGPFVRSGPLDLDHAFEPERRLRREYELPGLYRSGWRALPAGLKMGFVPFEEVTPIPRGCGYALTYIYLPADGDYNLNLVTDDAVKIWLGDELIGIRDDVRANPAVELDFPFHARAGWHRLLIKCNRNNFVSSSQVEVVWGFKAELTDAEGRHVEGLRSIAEFDPGVRLARGVRPLESPPSISPGDGLAESFYHALILAHREDYDNAVELLEEVVEERPYGLPLRLLLAWLLEADGSEERLGRARTHYQRLVTLDPLTVQAQLSLAEFEAREGKYWNSLQRLQGLHAEAAPNPRIELALAQRYNTQSVTPREGEAYVRAAELAPDHLDALLQLARHQNRVDDKVGAIRTLERLIELAPYHRRGLNDLATLLQRGGYYREAAVYYQRLLEIDPYDAGSMLELARCYRMGGFGDRLEVFQRLIDVSPYDYRGYANLALALEELDEGPAGELLALSLQRYPAKNWLRRYLAWRTGALADEFMPDLDELLSHPLEAADHPKSDAAMLLDYMRLDINADYTYATAVRHVVKILAPSGVDRWGEVVVPDSDNMELIHARTYTPDGQILEATTFNTTSRGLAISMEGVRPGAIIDVYYRQHREFRIVSEIFQNWSSRYYFREYGDPLINSRFVVTAPDTMEPSFDRMNFRGDFRQERLPDGLTTAGGAAYSLEPRNVFIHEVNNAQAIHSEGLMPERGSFTPFVLYSTLDDPEVYFDWYYGRALSALRSDSHLRELAAGLTEGLATPLERARSLYSYVVQQIKSAGAGTFFPASSRLTYFKRAGRNIDKLILFIALCREADLEIELCLTRSRWDGPRMKHAFTPSEFTNPVGRLVIDGREYWVDFTAGSVPLGYFGISNEGQQAWRCEARRFTRLPRRPLGDHLNQIVVELRTEPGLPTQGRMEQTVHGLSSALRVNYVDQRDARDMIDHELNNMFPGAELLEFTTENATRINEPFSYRVDFTAPAQGVLEGSRLRLPVVLYPFQLSRSFITRTERRYDLAYSDFLCQDETLVYRLDPDWRVDPQSLFIEKLAHLEAVYRLEARIDVDEEGPILVVHRLLELPPQQVAVRDYPDFREFCRRLDELERRQLIIELN